MRESESKAEGEVGTRPVFGKGNQEGSLSSQIGVEHSMTRSGERVGDRVGTGGGCGAYRVQVLLEIIAHVLLRLLRHDEMLSGGKCFG
jgi:hypothetical protein